MCVYIGCGGYIDEDWMVLGLIYEGVKKDVFLEIYVYYFDVVEFNLLFYVIFGFKVFEGMVCKLGGWVCFVVKLNKVFIYVCVFIDIDFD